MKSNTLKNLFGNYKILRTCFNLNVPNIYFIFLELRQRGRFAGFSLYISNSNDTKNSNLCYKDGPQLPPLNFTTFCIGYGRYVFFYNERLHGVPYPSGYQLSSIYTELCEVIVQGNTRPLFQTFDFFKLRKNIFSTIKYVHCDCRNYTSKCLK